MDEEDPRLLEQRAASCAEAGDYVKVTLNFSEAAQVTIERPARNACAALLSGKEKIELYASSQSFRIGPFEIQPFLTVHDAADPVAIAVTHVENGCKMGVATDLGRPTASVRAALRGGVSRPSR